MQGVWYQAPGGLNRLRYKKDLVAQAEAHPETIVLEATSVFGNEYEGPAVQAPTGTYVVVGPDPYRARNWYASIEVIRSPAGRSLKVC